MTNIRKRNKAQQLKSREEITEAEASVWSARDSLRKQEKPQG